MKTTSIPKASYLLFLLTVLCLNASAKSFLKGKPGGHEADAYAILPFERSAQITDWFETIHKTIDFPYNCYFEGLRNPPHQHFSWGSYGHRLFFHWGFNGKPWSALVEERVLECHWDAQTVTLFKQKLIDEQARRNRLVMEKTSQTLHLGMSGKLRGYTNAFASLVYDTHILGDYTTTKQAPLQELNVVINDIQTALYNKLQGGEEALRVNKLLENTKRQYSDPKTRALKVFEIMKKEVPGVILKAQGGYFKKHFEQYGITMKLP
jgi:hypothetical protein